MWHRLRINSRGSAGISPSDPSRKSPWSHSEGCLPLLCICKVVVRLHVNFLFFYILEKHSPRNQWVVWLVSTLFVLFAEVLTIPSVFMYLATSNIVLIK